MGMLGNLEARFLTSVITSALKQVLGGVLEQSSPDALVNLIMTNTSLWGENSVAITDLKESYIPPGIAAKGKLYFEMMKDQCGGVEIMINDFLLYEYPDYYSAIQNTPGGPEWLDDQINEIESNLV